MNALILAAGHGARLGDLGRTVPKPLLPVGGTTPLERHLANCVRAGVATVCINTHHCAAQIRAAAGDGGRFGLRIVYSFEPELLGTAGALANFREHLGAAPFFVLYGDNLVTADLAALGRFHRAAGALVTVGLHRRADVSMSGMVVLDAAGRITRFVEKPAPAERAGDLVNAGVYVVEPGLYDLLPPPPCDFGRDLFPRLMAAGRPLFGRLLDGPVVPLDTPELLARARVNPRR